jgi:shikimate kinase
LDNNGLVFLWGMPGVGKSSLGKKLAKLLNWNWIDLDQFIEEKQNCSITQLVSMHGASYFRKTEEDSLKSIIHLKNTIISCGGGTPVYANNAQTMLNAGICIYLVADTAFIHSRLRASQQERFLFNHSQPEMLMAEIEKLYNERKSVYELAHLHVKIPKSSIEQIFLELKILLEIA